MNKVIINVGVSGSGKTTWSTEYIKNNPKTIRINRDSIRLGLCGTLDDYYQSKLLNMREDMINNIEEYTLIQALLKGFDVIIDNTNLKLSYISRWENFVKQWNEEEAFENQVSFNFKLFTESNVDTLKKRVNVRDAPLGWDKLDYIDKQVASLPNIFAYIKSKYSNQIINE